MKYQFKMGVGRIYSDAALLFFVSVKRLLPDEYIVSGDMWVLACSECIVAKVWKCIGVMVCKKNAYRNCSGALTNCSGTRNTYNCSGTLIAATEDL